MNINIITRNGMSDEELEKFKAEFEKLSEVPLLYDGKIKFVGFKYPRWKKWRDKIWNSLPVILLEMKLREVGRRISGFVGRGP